MRRGIGDYIWPRVERVQWARASRLQVGFEHFAAAVEAIVRAQHAVPQPDGQVLVRDGGRVEAIESVQEGLVQRLPDALHEALLHHPHIVSTRRLQALVPGACEVVQTIVEGVDVCIKLRELRFVAPVDAAALFKQHAVLDGAVELRALDARDVAEVQRAYQIDEDVVHSGRDVVNESVVARAPAVQKSRVRRTVALATHVVSRHPDRHYLPARVEIGAITPQLPLQQCPLLDQGVTVDRTL